MSTRATAAARRRAGRSVALVVNPLSGSCDPDLLRRELRRLGVAARTFHIGDEAAAVASKPDLLVVAGGDGSIALSAIAARAANLPLGVVPAGTANDFARAAGLPRDHAEAIELAVTGSVETPFDLGWVEGHARAPMRDAADSSLGHGRASSSATLTRRPFLNTASIGLPVEAARRALRWKRSAGAAAYAIGAAHAAGVAVPLDIDVRVDGTLVHHGDAWQVTLANTGSFGGGARLDADLDDHELDVVVLPAGPVLPRLTPPLGPLPGAGGLRRSPLRLPRIPEPTPIDRIAHHARSSRIGRAVRAIDPAGRAMLPAHAISLKFGTRQLHPGVRLLRGAEVELTSTQPIEVNLDGDVHTFGTHATARIEADVFRVVTG